MKPRAKGADRFYWDEALDNNFQQLALFRDRLIIPEIQGTAEQILPAFRYFDSRFKRILLGYSAGAPVADLADDYADAFGSTYPDFLAANPKGSAGAINQPSFPRMARLLSMGVMCGLRGDAAAGLVRAYDHWDFTAAPIAGARDRIWEAMAAYLAPDTPRPADATGVNFAEAYAPLWDAMAPGVSEADRLAHLKDFLKGWYGQMKAEFEAETAEFSENNYVYVGHWCVEAGAAVVITGIDDKSLRRNRHYPKDFVDFARGCS